MFTECQGSQNHTVGAEMHRVVGWEVGVGVGVAQLHHYGSPFQKRKQPPILVEVRPKR